MSYHRVFIFWLFKLPSLKTIFMPEHFRSCVSLILKILSQVSFQKMSKMCLGIIWYLDITRNVSFSSTLIETCLTMFKYYEFKKFYVLLKLVLFAFETLTTRSNRCLHASTESTFTLSLTLNWVAKGNFDFWVSLIQFFITEKLRN